MKFKIETNRKNGFQAEEQTKWNVGKSKISNLFAEINIMELVKHTNQMTSRFDCF